MLESAHCKPPVELPRLLGKADLLNNMHVQVSFTKQDSSALPHCQIYSIQVYRK